MQACVHFPSKANPLAVYLKEICKCVVSARNEFHTIEMQFSNRKEKKPQLFWPSFQIKKKKFLSLPNQSLGSTQIIL